MVESSTLIYSQLKPHYMPVCEFEDRIPLPIGAQLSTPGRRVHANPLISWPAQEIRIHSTTENGWPTIILAKHDDGTIGVAIGYPGDWDDGPIEEIDILLTEHQTWACLIAYQNQSTAIADGRYDIEDYQGYELHEWNPENHPQIIKQSSNNKVTPIFYTPEAPDQYLAHTYQRSDSYETLENMFRLQRYPAIRRRQKRLRELVVPRDLRWKEENTHFQDIAKDILESESN